MFSQPYSSSISHSLHLSFFPLFLFSIYSLLPLYVRVYLRTRTFVYVRMYLLSIFILLLLLFFWFYFLWFFAFDSRYYFFHELLFWWRRFCLVIFFSPFPLFPNHLEVVRIIPTRCISSPFTAKA